MNPGSVLDWMLRFRWIPEDPADPLDPVQSSARLIFIVKNRFFFTILWENDRHFWGVELLGALLAPRWAQMRSRPPVELHLEASWGSCWRQDAPSEFGQIWQASLQEKNSLSLSLYIYIYIYKLPIHRIHAAG